MLYCEQCRMLMPEPCTKRGHAMRGPLDHDPVLLLKAGTVQAAMFEEMLKQAGIPTLKEGRMGAGLSTWAGPMLEDYSLYVPHAAFERAHAIVSLPPQEEEDGDPLPEDDQDEEDWEEHLFMDDQL